jgi:uncharacterized protein (TIGR02145 family)
MKSPALCSFCNFSEPGTGGSQFLQFMPGGMRQAVSPGIFAEVILAHESNPEAMKTNLFCLVVLLLTASPSISQNEPSYERKYETWLIRMPEKNASGIYIPRKTIRGLLYEVNDSSVIVQRKMSKAEKDQALFDYQALAAKNIEQVILRKKGSGIAIAIGAATGAAVGTAISYAYSQSLAQSNPLGYIFGGFIVGALPVIVSTGLGIITGVLCAKKTKFRIDGKQRSFDEEKEMMSGFAMVNRTTSSQARIFSITLLPDSLTDIEGNRYPLFMIGSRVWMAGNLRTRTFRNGEKIPFLQQQNEWAKSQGAACSLSEPDETAGGDGGLLYNWKAVNDKKGLCPGGWHVPSDQEWLDLAESLGGIKKAAIQLSEAGDPPFSAPARFRFGNGEYSAEEGNSSQWWSVNPGDSPTPRNIMVNGMPKQVLFVGTQVDVGISLRCIKDN